MCAVLIDADTAVWNALCDQSVDARRLTKARTWNERELLRRRTRSLNEADANLINGPQMGIPPDRASKLPVGTKITGQTV